MTAHDILQAAAGHMKDRAATYDKPQGERSMGATVESFKAVTGHDLTEEQGWLFMALLKAVRSQQGAYRSDSYEDGAAYFALAGESASRDRKKRVIRELYTEATEARMDVVGQNGNTAEHYPADEWIPSNGKEPCLPYGALVDVKFLDGCTEDGRFVDSWAWSQDGTSDDITHYRIHQPDWSQAPEGATHYGPETEEEFAAWYKKEDDQWMFWVSPHGSEWIKTDHHGAVIHRPE